MDKQKETPAKAEAIEIDPRLIGVKEIREVSIKEATELSEQGWNRLRELSRPDGLNYVMVRY